MDQASASPAASCARIQAAPKTSSSCSRSVDQSRTAGPPPARSAPQSGPHSEPVHIAPRSSSPALRRFEAKGHPLPDFYSGATGKPGRFSEGLLLRPSHGIVADTKTVRKLKRGQPSIQKGPEDMERGRSLHAGTVLTPRL